MYNSSSDSDEGEELEGYYRRQRVFKKRINFGEITDPYKFKEKFRLSKTAVEEVRRRIGDEIRHATKRNFALDPMNQILLSLHWMGTGCQYHGVADMHGVYKSTVHRTLKRVVAAIVTTIFPEEVKWPEGNQALETCRQFFTYAEFPKVAGCVDGTLITIDSPSVHEASYVDRKGSHSLNAIVVCGPKLEFYYASSRWPGSVHDSRVLRNSSLFTAWNGGWRPFPGAVLLGDSGYPLLEWLLTPISRNVNLAALEVYLRKHKSTRRLVECAIGVLKERFPCLNHLRVEVEFAAKIILACIALHNVEIKLNGTVQFELCQDEVDGSEDGSEEVGEAVEGATTVYEEFINYFA